HYLDGQLIPEGTCYAYSPHRRDGSSGLEYAGSRYLPTGSVRAIVPRYRRDRSDLLPLHPRDHPIRAIHRAGRRHCGHLLHARHRTYACHWHSERARSPLIPNQEKERATSGSPHLYDYRLPAPLPITWIAVFAGITVPYVIFLIAVGLPFNHNLVWLYILPPGVL